MRMHIRRYPTPTNTYHVDATAGNDAYSGAADKPLQTIAAVNALALKPGDRVLLKAGETWTNTTITVPANGKPGRPIYFGSYGTGAKPKIDGAYAVTTFVADVDSIYKKTGVTFYPTQIFEDGVRLIRKTAYASLAQGSWFLDDAADTLYVWATDNADPDTHTMEVSVQVHGFDFNGKSNITVQNLECTRQGFSCFSWRTAGSNNCEALDCDASWQWLRGFDWGGTAAYKNYCVARRCTGHDGIGENFWIGFGVGNGAEDCYAYNGGKERNTKGYTDIIANGSSNFMIHGTTINAFLRRCHSLNGYNASSALGIEQESSVFAVGAIVEGCLVEQLVAPCVAADSQGYGSIWRNNIIMSTHGTNDVQLFRVWNGAVGEIFLNNTFRMKGENTNCFIATGGTVAAFFNNLLLVDSTSTSTCVRIASDATTGWDADNNCYYDKQSWYWVSTWYNLANWRIQSGKDANCIVTDPTVVNVDSDFHLQAGSPAIGAGATGKGVLTDYDGVVRASPPAIGAYEYVA